MTEEARVELESVVTSGLPLGGYVSGVIAIEFCKRHKTDAERGPGVNACKECQDAASTLLAEIRPWTINNVVEQITGWYGEPEIERRYPTNATAYDTSQRRLVFTWKDLT